MSKFSKYFILASGIALFATFVRIPGTNIKVHAQSGGCSVASLKGTYAYLRTGVNSALGGPVAEMGLDVFNGEGTRGIIRSTGGSLDGSYDWTNATWPNGTYTVSPDCTGSLFAADGTKANIIVLEGGKSFSVLSGLNQTGKVVTGEATRMEQN
jgi:hypothetical protein